MAEVSGFNLHVGWQRGRERLPRVRRALRTERLPVRLSRRMPDSNRLPASPRVTRFQRARQT